MSTARVQPDYPILHPIVYFNSSIEEVYRTSLAIKESFGEFEQLFLCSVGQRLATSVSSPRLRNRCVTQGQAFRHLYWLYFLSSIGRVPWVCINPYFNPKMYILLFRLQQTVCSQFIGSVQSVTSVSPFEEIRWYKMQEPTSPRFQSILGPFYESIRVIVVYCFEYLLSVVSLITLKTRVCFVFYIQFSDIAFDCNRSKVRINLGCNRRIFGLRTNSCEFLSNPTVSDRPCALYWL